MIPATLARLENQHRYTQRPPSLPAHRLIIYWYLMGSVNKSKITVPRSSYSLTKPGSLSSLLAFSCASCQG